MYIRKESSCIEHWTINNLVVYLFVQIYLLHIEYFLHECNVLSKIYGTELRENLVLSKGHLQCSSYSFLMFIIHCYISTFYQGWWILYLLWWPRVLIRLWGNLSAYWPTISNTGLPANRIKYSMHKLCTSRQRVIIFIIF